MSRAKWKHSNITKDIISFFLINSKSSINKKTNLNHINSYIYYQPKNTFSFYLQNRTLQVTKLVFYLNKIFTFHIHTGKKYFPCYKTLSTKYKLGHFFYTRVTRQQIRKARSKKKKK